MTDHSPKDRAPRGAHTVDRRHLLGIGAGVGVTLLAGCTGQSDSGTGGDDGTTSDSTTDSETTGSFRLLISDQPVAIGDFDSLNVSFDRARIFKQGDEEDDQAANETETEDDQEVETENGTNESETEDDQEVENETNESEMTDDEPRDEDQEVDDDEANSREGGFSIIDLDGATVDLTEVVGDKAIGVFDGELEAGSYSKIELYASNVDGVVDGNSVDVTIPSGKLQITKPFEITADETLSFVFDINVVKKGNKAAYNLLPVISESGVAGKDVDVEEVDKGQDNDNENGADEQDADGDETNSTADGDETNSTDQNGTETVDDE